jgi:predicted dehydrogenase
MHRRTFLRTASLGGIGLAAGKFSSLSAQVRSPNETVTVAIMGLNGRGTALAESFAKTPNAQVAYLCDVDSDVLAKAMTNLGKVVQKAPKPLADFRRALEDPDMDALVIAAPDHWHAPATILAMQAGKHVYLEKPCAHNAHEGELLIEAQRKYQRTLQLGTQQRSGPRTIEIVQSIHEGVIGKPYLARAWYANTRDTIGRGKTAPVPAKLDYELWQGPAPRTPYKDNVVHYNWHWFWNWGTGEICNNGTHEVDVCRWVLGVDYPVRVTSAGGRYHFQDDWEFYDTQEASFEFEGGKTIVWEGRSCNGYPTHGRGRGCSIHGTNGTVIMDRNGYSLYDAKNALVMSSIGDEQGNPLDTRAADRLTDLHVVNFVEAVRTGAPLKAPIEENHKSVLLCHLGNIAQATGRSLRTDAKTGRILEDAEAMKMWRREYAPGWEPAL